MDKLTREHFRAL